MTPRYFEVRLNFFHLCTRLRIFDDKEWICGFNKEVFGLNGKVRSNGKLNLLLGGEFSWSALYGTALSVIATFARQCFGNAKGAVSSWHRQTV